MARRDTAGEKVERLDSQGNRISFTAMYAIAEIAFSFLLSLLWWILLYPVVLLVSTPFILILAPFQKGPYRRAVVKMFRSVGGFWKEWGILIVP